MFGEDSDKYIQKISGGKPLKKTLKKFIGDLLLWQLVPHYPDSPGTHRRLDPEGKSRARGRGNPGRLNHSSQGPSLLHYKGWEGDCWIFQVPGERLYWTSGLFPQSLRGTG